MKLSNIFKGNVLVMTQSPHGDLQNKKSIDCVGAGGDLTIYAPADGKITGKYGSATQSGFHLVADNWDILFHHCSTEIRANTTVKRGQVIGKSSWHHVHTAIRVDNNWDVLLNYMDRSIRLELIQGFSSLKWKDWATWQDLQLPPIIPEKNKESYELLKVQRPDVIKVYPLDKIHYWFRDYGLVEYPVWVEKLRRDVAQKVNMLENEQNEVKKLQVSNSYLSDQIHAQEQQIGALQREKSNWRTDELDYLDTINELNEKIKKLEQKNNENEESLIIRIIRWLTSR